MKKQNQQIEDIWRRNDSEEDTYGRQCIEVNQQVHEKRIKRGEGIETEIRATKMVLTKKQRHPRKASNIKDERSGNQIEVNKDRRAIVIVWSLPAKPTILSKLNDSHPLLFHVNRKLEIFGWVNSSETNIGWWRHLVDGRPIRHAKRESSGQVRWEIDGFCSERVRIANDMWLEAINYPLMWIIVQLNMFAFKQGWERIIRKCVTGIPI